MNKYYYIFIGQIIAATKGNKQFFVSKHNRATHALASVFKELNIIKKITEPSDKIIRNMPRAFRNNYKIFWLTPVIDNSRVKGKLLNTPQHSEWTKNKWFYNKIVVIKPRVFHKNILSYRELAFKKPFHNTIYILQTVKGVMTSREAIKQKIGGIILCIIHL